MIIHPADRKRAPRISRPVVEVIKREAKRTMICHFKSYKQFLSIVLLKYSNNVLHNCEGFGQQKKLSTNFSILGKSIFPPKKFYNINSW